MYIHWFSGVRKKPASPYFVIPYLIGWGLEMQQCSSYEAVAIIIFVCLRPQHQAERLLKWATGYVPKQLERSRSEHAE